MSISFTSPVDAPTLADLAEAYLSAYDSLDQTLAEAKTLIDDEERPATGLDEDLTSAYKMGTEQLDAMHGDRAVARSWAGQSDEDLIGDPPEDVQLSERIREQLDETRRIVAVGAGDVFDRLDLARAGTDPTSTAETIYRQARSFAEETSLLGVWKRQMTNLLDDARSAAYSEQ